MPSIPYAATPILGVLAAVGLLAGCGASDGPQVRTSAPASASPSMPGMAMPAEAAPGKPTATQAMVCGSEVRGDIRTALDLTTAPSTDSVYADALFTCDYHLSTGLMRLSVKHLADPATALAFLKAQSRSAGAGEDLAGLGDTAYGDGNGRVYTIKDNEVLMVDTTRLPVVFGPQHQKRSDLAYEIASVVLGCWTGDDES